ncbi:MAG: serine protease [Verrucomicrobiaceae bacterium]|nr:serine protease [Verrucomicrobiaceae bacterium]
MPKLFAFIFGAALIKPASAELSRPTLVPEQRTNGAETLLAIGKMAPEALHCAARIESLLGRDICAATLVSEDGYLLTKASDVPDVEAVRLRLSDGRSANLREVHRDTRLDLLLAHAAGITAARSATFGPSRTLSVGQWLCGQGEDDKHVSQAHLGVLSAARRRIPGNGAAMGIQMEESSAGASARPGVRLLSIAADSPAEEAGLQKGDILLAIDDEAASSHRQMHELIKARQPGDVLEVRYLRGKREHIVRVRLASRTKVIQNWAGDDFANGGVSRRTDNFPEVIQHTIPLDPVDMGGPLSTLEGRIIGVQIARVDRVTTFALPMEIFWTQAQQWIQADRHPPRAVKVQRGE